MSVICKSYFSLYLFSTDVSLRWLCHNLFSIANYGVCIHSLEGNRIGHFGATALADTLRVNQNLKTLK